MRLASVGPAGAEQLAVLTGDGMLLIAAVLADAGIPVTDPRAIVALWPAIEPLVKRELQDGAKIMPVGSARLGPPVPRPGKVVAVGFNYRQHTNGVLAGVTAPGEPILFLKPPESVTGARDPVRKPAQTQQLDYELELAVVIGRACRGVPAARALQHVFGYAIANDVTARDVAIGGGFTHPMLAQVARGKGFPTFCPLGPWVRTSDEIGDPAALRMRLWVNDDLRQDDLTGSMIFGVPELIESVSSTMPLMPGDIILTGTPAGCGFQLEPARYLTAGDVIRAEIDGLGEMVTTVADDPVRGAERTSGG